MSKRMKNGKPEHGDIIRVNLNPTLGHEQSGTRPVLVVSEGGLAPTPFLLNTYFGTERL
ncbi:MAG: type II toxin-antitoxin system PemK/MazF family toxin [Oscillospiraceae bacterium]|nr:type II toxin-antitoxin system PemK/MazF family toxin [Oscillospiraceae bacterium]